MTSYFTPPLYNKNGLEAQWVNSIWQSHDLICGCNRAFQHLAAILQQKNIKCLPSTSTGDAGVQTEDGDAKDLPEEGDLDKLFEEDFTEDDG